MSISSDLTALCTDTSTLVNDILAQSVLADIPAADMATLGSLPSNGSSLIVQLGAGGNATLQVPVLAGQGRRIRVVGWTHNPSNTGSDITVYLQINGNQMSFAVTQGGNATYPDTPFIFDGVLSWDSSTNKGSMVGFFVHHTPGANSAPTANYVSDPVDASSPTSFACVIGAHTNGSSNPSGTVTITEFRAYAD